MEYDFSGWATRNNLLCSDGRTIMQDAFKDQDGEQVPLVWNHQHNDPLNVLGHAVLENRNDGVYAYCKFNDTEQGKNAKLLVEHGDVSALSIWANKLKQQGGNVLHGAIREVSLVLAGANPGAFIDAVIQHGEESDEEAIIYTGEDIQLFHAEDEETETEESPADESSEEETEIVSHADDDNKEPEVEDKEESIKDVINSMTEKQQDVLFGIVGDLIGDDEDDENSEGGNDNMKHNVFDAETAPETNVLSHSAQGEILEIAKSNSCGSFRDALKIYSQEHEVTLSHGAFNDEDTEALFPEYKDVYPGAPELITRDQGWITHVLAKTHKSPITRIRTRQADARIAELRAKGYQKGEEKTLMAQIQLLSRTTDPQTVYIKDQLHRDDILDITDFDVVDYNYKIMRMTLNEELAMAVMLGDGRVDGDEDKIYPDKIRPIWTDVDPYVIHADVDIAAARQELQGTDTNKHFGENYVYAEAIITAALYAREQYKGSGSLEFYCTPHLLNVMLLARDLNGRRIYNSVTDIAAALNVTAIHTAEQFENKTREVEGDTKKLLGIFVNLADYQIGSVKGGEITKFEDFDIDFNRYKYLLETRLSGALTRVYSAIVLEEPVVAETNGGTSGTDPEVSG